MNAPEGRRIRTLLIANRGEIACRIARTCRRLGIRSVAVVAPDDREALHARAADLALPLDPEGAPDGYRDIAGLVAAARRAGADAVHPGYGFLAENAAFAEACVEAGLTFVGPSAAAIAAMGDKTEAKRLAREAGVPVLPGAEDADDASGEARDAALLEAVRDVPYPLVVKAAAGGGGKGMRRVDTQAALPAAVAQVRQEARAVFGSDRLLVERYVARPRHVEVQVLGDMHGTVLHLHDRDCSIQRRHQKLIEEAPAPDLSEAARAELHDAALRLARAIDYRNAGTVEFVLDAATGEAFFLEMNTRLQVEHPVTEAVFGLDLVEWQLRIAMGEPLPFEQGDLIPDGCAVEARLNAEDPAQDFAPATGRLAMFAPPRDTDLRVESGVETGSRVTPHYDSLLAKLIAWGPDRRTAMAKLAAGLRGTAVFGVRTTAPLLAELLSDPGFVAGAVTTHYLADRDPDGWPGPDAAETDRPQTLLHAAAALAALAALEGDGPSPWSGLRFWRVAGDAAQPGRAYVVLDDPTGARHRFWVQPGVADAAGVEIGLRPFDAPDAAPVMLRIVWTPDPAWAGAGDLSVDGPAGPRRYRALRAARTLHLDDGAGWAAFAWLDPGAADLAEAPAGAAGDGRVLAPMPGRVQSVEVSVGDRVAHGDAVLVLESMKMFHSVAAPLDGTVAALPRTAGETVASGDLLVEIEPDAAAAQPD